MAQLRMATLKPYGKQLVKIMEHLGLDRHGLCEALGWHYNGPQFSVVMSAKHPTRPGVKMHAHIVEHLTRLKVPEDQLAELNRLFEEQHGQTKSPVHIRGYLSTEKFDLLYRYVTSDLSSEEKEAIDKELELAMTKTLTKYLNVE